MLTVCGFMLLFRVQLAAQGCHKINPYLGSNRCFTSTPDGPEFSLKHIQDEIISQVCMTVSIATRAWPCGFESKNVISLANGLRSSDKYLQHRQVVKKDNSFLQKERHHDSSRLAVYYYCSVLIWNHSDVAGTRWPPVVVMSGLPRTFHSWTRISLVVPR